MANLTFLKSNLAQRAAVALPFAAAVLYATSLRNSWPIAVISWVGLFVCWREFLKLTLPGRVPRLFYYVGSIALTVLYIVGVLYPDYFVVAISLSVGIMFMMNMRDYVASTEQQGKLESFIPIVAAPMGLLYVLTLLMFLPKIHLLPQGNVLLGVYFIGVWACDIGAYFTGRFLGRTPLSPEISPRKTWEGLIGGILLTLLTILVFRFTWAPFLEWFDIALLFIVLGPTSQLGDLAESLLKRSVSKKDAGNFLIGHGGLLDRIDSYLLSAPLFYLYASLRFGVTP